MAERETYVLIPEPDSEGSVVVAIEALLDVLRPVISVARIDVDGEVAVPIDPSDEKQWSVLRSNAPRSAHVDVYGPNGDGSREVAIIRECGARILAELTDDEADEVEERIGDSGQVLTRMQWAAMRRRAHRAALKCQFSRAPVKLALILVLICVGIGGSRWLLFHELDNQTHSQMVRDEPVDTFLSAMQFGQYQLAEAQLSSRSQAQVTPADLQAWRARNLPNESGDAGGDAELSLFSEMHSGHTVTIIFGSFDSNGPQLTVTPVKENGEWKIDLPADFKTQAGTA